MKRIISVKVSPIPEFRSQSDLEKCKFSNLALTSTVSEVYKTKRLSQEAINLNYGINESNSANADIPVLPTVKKSTNYKAWWEHEEDVNTSASNSHSDNSSFNSKLKCNEFEAILMNSPSVGVKNCIPFAFQILDDQGESETPEEENGVKFLGAFSDDSKQESELDDLCKNQGSQNAINSFETSSNLIKKAEYVIPISNFNNCHKINEKSHSEILSIGPLLININTYGEAAETANVQRFTNFDTLSKCIEHTNKNQTRISTESNSICNQSMKNPKMLPNFKFQEGCKIPVAESLSTDKHSFSNRNISGQFNSFQKHTQRSKVKTVSIKKSSVMLIHKCEKTSDDKYRCLLTNDERKKCKDVKAAGDSESEEEFFIRIPLMKRKTRSFCCHEKNCKSKNRCRFPKNECNSKKKGEKRNKNSLVIKKNSVVTSNTYCNCIILDKDKTNKFEESVLQKHLINRQEEELKPQASCSEVYLETGLLSRPVVENRNLKYNDENNRKLRPSGGSNKRSFNFTNLESNKPKKIGVGEENWKFRKGKNFEYGNLVRTVNKKELKPLVDFVAVDETPKVNTKEKLAKFNLGNDMISTLYGTSHDQNGSFENKHRCTPRYSVNKNERSPFMKHESLKSTHENDQRWNLEHHTLRSNCGNSMHHAGQFREEVETATCEKYLVDFSTEIDNFHETLKESNNSRKHYVINQNSNFQENKEHPLPITPVLIFPVKYDESFKRLQEEILHNSPKTDTESPKSEHKTFSKAPQSAFTKAIGNEDFIQIKEISLKDNHLIVSGNRLMPKSCLNKSLIPITELFHENIVGNPTSSLLNDESPCSSARGSRGFTQNMSHQSAMRGCLIINSNNESSENQIINFNKQSKKSEDQFEEYSSFKRQGENIAINSSSGKEMAQILYGASVNYVSARNRNICHSPKLESKKSTKNALLTGSKYRQMNDITEKSNAKDWASIHQEQNSRKSKSSRYRKPCGIVPGLNIE